MTTAHMEPSWTRPAHTEDQATGLPTMESLEELVRTQRIHGDVFLRISPGPRTDEREGTTHPESGYPLPGVPAWPLRPEPWWHAGPAAWIARQLVQHSYLLSPTNRPWLLTGQVVGRGADCEPLVRQTTPIALVGQGALFEAESTYAAWRCRDFR